MVAQIHNLKWHKENCPCEGKPQEVSARLQARQNELPPSNQGKTKFHKAGSQNRNK